MDLPANWSPIWRKHVKKIWKKLCFMGRVAWWLMYKLVTHLNLKPAQCHCLPRQFHLSQLSWHKSLQVSSSLVSHISHPRSYVPLPGNHFLRQQCWWGSERTLPSFCIWNPKHVQTSQKWEDNLIHSPLNQSIFRFQIWNLGTYLRLLLEFKRKLKRQHCRGNFPYFSWTVVWIPTDKGRVKEEKPMA